MANYTTILVNRKHGGQIMEVVLNRPEKRNAVNFAMHREWDEALDEAEDDEKVKVVTLRGAGKIFSAGHDLAEVAEGYATVGRPSGAPVRRARGLPRAWYFPKPIVAGIHEYVGPIAQGILAHCDFVIAAEGTRLSLEQARLGGGGSGGDSIGIYLPMRVWKKFMMMGGWMDAAQAYQLAYVSKVVPRDKLEEEVDRWAKEICKIPVEQVMAAKAGIHRTYEIRGLCNIAGIGEQRSGHGSGRDKEFFKMVQEKGLKAALQFRDGDMDTELSRW